MAKGTLYEVTNESQLKWSFFSEDMVYLAGFSRRESAEFYGAMYGYDCAAPKQVPASVFDAQRVEKVDNLDIKANSPIPALRLKGASGATSPSPSRRAGSILGRRM